MAGRGPKRNVRRKAREEAVARETLERSWGGRMEHAPEYASLVTGDDGDREPFHRWLPYRQGFAPELVRRFVSDGELGAGPVCDPFSGSGTTVIECARMGVGALGIDVIPASTLLTRMRFLRERDAAPPDVEGDARESATWTKAFASAESDFARTAVLLAAARTVTGSGKPRKDLPPAREMLVDAATMMATDLAAPLPRTAAVVTGDARRMPLADGSVGGIPTSPPYLSRYDYTRILRPVEQTLGREAPRTGRVRAKKRGSAKRARRGIHPAADEAAERLFESGKKKEGGAVLAYVEDAARIVAECARALAPGAPLMLVVAGCHVDRVYVPADLIWADLCESFGLHVEELLHVRDIDRRARRLGRLDAVAPREIILSARARRA